MTALPPPPADGPRELPELWWSPSRQAENRSDGLHGLFWSYRSDKGFVTPWHKTEDAVRLVPAPAVAVPAETRDEPHDPAHLMYDADTGVCLDCDRIVDPIAAPVAAAFPAAMRAYQDTAEFTEAEDAERVVTAILRAAFRTTRRGTS